MKSPSTRALLLVAGLALAGCGTPQYLMPNVAMEPTIMMGSRFKVDRYGAKNPARWDVIVFEPPGRPELTWAFRVVALPGETVTIEDGVLMVGGAALSPPVDVDYGHMSPVGGTVEFPHVVPSGEYFVLGDHPERANDSRYWGTVPRRNIIGKVPGI